MRFIRFLLLSLVGLSAVTQAAQEMHTCMIDGKKVIQDKPCSLPPRNQQRGVEKTAAQIQAEFDAEKAKKADEERRKTEADAKRVEAKNRMAEAQRECQEANKSPPVVRNSSLDGSVSEVKEYLNKTLRDPSSFEAIRWGNVVRTCDGYTVFLSYRAKNGYGGMTVVSGVYLMDRRGAVVSVQR